MSLTKNILIAVSLVALTAIISTHCLRQTGQIYELQRQLNLLKNQWLRLNSTDEWTEEESSEEESSDSDEDSMHSANVSAMCEKEDDAVSEDGSVGEEDAMIIEQE